MNQKKTIGTIMEFCISPKAAKFFFVVFLLITIACFVRVESQKTHSGVQEDLDTFASALKVSSTSDPFESAETPKKSFFTSSPTRSEPEAPKSFPPSSRRNTRKPVDPCLEWIHIFLAPSTLSRADFFQHLLREVSKIQPWKIHNARLELKSCLKTNKISESVMPYARALETIVSAVCYLQKAKLSLEEIRNQQYAPPEVSSPSGLSSYGLFSSDIFTDPDAPSRLINKLIETPKSEIRNVKIQLKDYLKTMEKWEHGGLAFWRYQYYAENLKDFLQNESSLLDNLKRNMDEIQRLYDLKQNSTDGKMNDETSSAPT